MPYTGTEVAEEARSVHLNEGTVSLFTDVRLFPIVRKCYEDAQMRCAREGVPVLSEVSGIVPYAANGLFVTSPTDLLLPKMLGARPVGSTSAFVPMHEELWEPEALAQPSLTHWTWREETIYVLPSTAAQEVKIRYTKNLPVLTSSASNLLIANLKSYLAAKVAAVVWVNIMENHEQGGIVNGHAEELWDDFISNHTKKKQNTPVRRRSFRRPRMRILG